ncbi:hypothetical protein ACP70R_020046 [Stipagrostis hirtigluma subsp. patula]
MAIPVARVYLAMEHASLPGLLPTPPPISPLLMASSRLLVLPAKSPSKSKPSRADSDERWDARKITTKPPAKPGRADSDERWDAYKIKPVTTASPAAAASSGSGLRSPDGKISSSSSGRAPSCERWNSNKKSSTSSSPASSSSSLITRESTSTPRWNSSDKRPLSRASSAGRWDAHKKPRPPLPDVVIEVVGDGESSTGSNDVDDGMELDEPPYAGPGFAVSPDPSTLPMPTMFMLRAR